ncbi:MAG: hypothetical protein ACLPN5_22045 [Roseiarcus sp.]
MMPVWIWFKLAAMCGVIALFVGLDGFAGPVSDAPSPHSTRDALEASWITVAFVVAALACAVVGLLAKF